MPTVFGLTKEELPIGAEVIGRCNVNGGLWYALIAYYGDGPKDTFETHKRTYLTPHIERPKYDLFVKVEDGFRLLSYVLK